MVIVIVIESNLNATVLDRTGLPQSLATILPPRGICESQRQAALIPSVQSPIKVMCLEDSETRATNKTIPFLPWVEWAGWIVPYVCTLDIVGDLVATGPIMARGGGTCTIIISYSALTIAAADDRNKSVGFNWTDRRRGCRTDNILHRCLFLGLVKLVAHRVFPTGEVTTRGLRDSDPKWGGGERSSWRLLIRKFDWMMISR